MVDSKMDVSGETSTSTKKTSVHLDADKVRKDIEAAKTLAGQGKAKDALEALLAVEKQCRNAEDLALSKETCSAILTVAHGTGNWSDLLEYITLLTKRRGQLKNTIQNIVRQAAGLLDSDVSRDNKVQLIKTMQAVTEGKIFVEIERARLTRRLARLYESEGKIAEAADCLQEIAVETFGAMHRSEKIAYMLEQMRLCMDKNDFVRAQILSRKVSPKAFAASYKGQEAGEISLQGTAIEEPEAGTPSMPELKLLYYNQMIRFHKHSNNYLEITRCLLSIYTSDGVLDSSDKWMPVLKQIVWYLVLAPAHSTAQGSASDHATLVATVAADPRLADLPEHKDLLQIFTTKEVAGANALLARYADEMAAQVDIFGGEAGRQRAEDFKRRITEHNILVIGKYYSQLRMQRLATLLDLPVQEAESNLSRLVVEKAIAAKINRPAGVVKFASAKNSLQVLDQWGDSISKLLGLVETACQKIQKESMQHHVPIGASM